MAGVSRNGGAVEFDLSVDPPMKEFQFRIGRFAEGVEDFSSCLRACGELFKRHMGEQFATQGEMTGSRWKVLTPRYAKRKAAMHAEDEKLYPGTTVGVLTGALRAAMTGGGGYTETITKTEGSFGMSDSALAAPYAKHFAAKRPVLRFKPSQGRQYQKVVHTWLVAEMRGSMGIGGSGLAGAVRAGGGVGNISSALSAVL
jgi:hypothetical protein